MLFKKSKEVIKVKSLEIYKGMLPKIKVFSDLPMSMYEWIQLIFRCYVCDALYYIFKL